jgi:hypothetical protein
MADFVIENGILKRYLGKKKIVNVPKEIHIIGKYAFAGCETLECVTIRDGVTEIEEGAFWKCWYLKEVVIPESVTKIGARAFADCKRLERVLLNCVETIEAWAFDHCDGLRSITLGNNIKTVDDHAFYDCDSLREIMIPVNVEHIGKDVFGRCPRLTVFAPENSDMELYAIENDIPFQAI